jgi:hypothetical protein
MTKLFQKGPDGRYSLAVWYHEGDFRDDRSATFPVSSLDNPTPGNVTTDDGVTHPAMIDEAHGYAVIDMPEEFVEGYP